MAFTGPLSHTTYIDKNGNVVCGQLPADDDDASKPEKDDRDSFVKFPDPSSQNDDRSTMTTKAPGEENGKDTPNDAPNPIDKMDGLTPSEKAHFKELQRQAGDSEVTTTSVGEENGDRLPDNYGVPPDGFVDKNGPATKPSEGDSFVRFLGPPVQNDGSSSTTKAMGEENGGTMTTMALGEEGGPENFPPPPISGGPGNGNSPSGGNDMLTRLLDLIMQLLQMLGGKTSRLD